MLPLYLIPEDVRSDIAPCSVPEYTRSLKDISSCSHHGLNHSIEDVDKYVVESRVNPSAQQMLISCSSLSWWFRDVGVTNERYLGTNESSQQGG